MLADPPTFSVIVPVHNGADHLTAAVDSLRNQSFQCFEILAIDDGSTDRSMELLENLAPGLSGKLRVLQHPGGRNKGIVSTYGLGISQARGKYVAFLEQDDAWTPNYLECKARLFDANPQVGVAFSPYKVVSSGLYGREMLLRQWVLQRRLPHDVPFNNFKNLIKCNNVASFSCFAARRELLVRLPSPEDRSIVYFDWWVLLSLSMQASFYYDRTSTCYWRHSRSSTLGRQEWLDHCQRGVTFFSAMYDFLDGCSDQLDRELQRQYVAERRYVPRFLEFLASRDLRAFTRFFVANPVWATSTLASLAVNYLKFRRNENPASSECADLR